MLTFEYSFVIAGCKRINDLLLFVSSTREISLWLSVTRTHVNIVIYFEFSKIFKYTNPSHERYYFQQSALYNARRETDYASRARILGVSERLTVYQSVARILASVCVRACAIARRTSACRSQTCDSRIIVISELYWD